MVRARHRSAEARDSIRSRARRAKTTRWGRKDLRRISSTSLRRVLSSRISYRSCELKMRSWARSRARRARVCESLRWPALRKWLLARDPHEDRRARTTGADQDRLRGHSPSLTRFVRLSTHSRNVLPTACTASRDPRLGAAYEGPKPPGTSPGYRAAAVRRPRRSSTWSPANGSCHRSQPRPRRCRSPPDRPHREDRVSGKYSTCTVRGRMRP